MTRAYIKKLAAASYTKDFLDSTKVNRITSYLNRKALKTYIVALKNIEDKKRITLLTPSMDNTGNILKEIKSAFPGKRVLIKEDKELIAGLRVVNGDNIYDFNFKNTLKNIVSFINQ